MGVGGACEVEWAELTQLLLWCLCRVSEPEIWSERRQAAAAVAVIVAPPTFTPHHWSQLTILHPTHLLTQDRSRRAPPPLEPRPGPGPGPETPQCCCRMAALPPCLLVVAAVLLLTLRAHGR